MPNHILHSCTAVISDLHIGSPENARLEDFDRDDDFQRLLQKELPARAAGRPVTLIINGDFIDFPQILPELGKTCPTERVGVTEHESLQRVTKAIQGHPRVFEALGTFLQAGNQVILLPGNHDVDLVFPDVLSAVRAAVGSPQAPAFELVPEGVIEEQGIHIEHGNQYSYDNWFAHWPTPILDDPGNVRRIERPWGTMFMDLIYNDLEEVYPFVNKVHPPMALARIILRLVRKDTKVTTHAIAQLLKFFVLRGKRMVLGHVLGKEEAAGAKSISRAEIEEAARAKSISRAEIEETARDLGVDIAPDRLKAVIDDVAASTGATDRATEAAMKDKQPVKGLLGRTDEQGLAERARDLLESGTVRVVVFGHTHESEDRTVEYPDRICRVLNTGGWVPRLVLPAGATASLAELEAAPREHELRYAWLELGEAGPIASLERLDSISP